ncbi:uncharacterized protein LOC143583629 [Bidens hawaiensis]|uniref:uncharacterized protein LOC143583629 n=1 Tax=Bidens hawaiensis TaxID=980011 RepID=UPI0040499DE1
MDSKLHPAITVSNIKTAVPIVLDNETGQYTSWSELFKIHCRAYQVFDHLLPQPTPTTTSSTAKPEEVTTALAAADLWDRLDAIVLQWIYGTISLDLLNTILKPNTTACEAWTTLETLFQDNKSSRAIYLNQKLNNTRLDNFDNMASYCQEVKVICDQLANVEAPLTDEKMVQQLVTGLNEQYEGIAMLISNLQPLPSFHEACSKLMREYDRKTNMTLHASQTAGAALMPQHLRNPRPIPSGRTIDPRLTHMLTVEEAGAGPKVVDVADMAVVGHPAATTNNPHISTLRFKVNGYSSLHGDTVHKQINGLLNHHAHIQPPLSQLVVKIPVFSAHDPIRPMQRVTPQPTLNRPYIQCHSIHQILHGLWIAEQPPT